jgi:hypothetical protein
MIRVHRKKGRLEIKAEAYRMGKDLCVIITGGDIPHLGAVTIGSRCEGFKTFLFEHHKENILTEMLADILKNGYSGNFAVCCGIHLDNITRDEIKDSIDLSKDIAEELCALLQKNTLD